jgi:Phage integrase family
MFRDTFAVELLKHGVSLETVSMLLGHASIKVTEKHYKPWVKTLQDKLETEAMKGWPLKPGGQERQGTGSALRMRGRRPAGHHLSDDKQPVS